MRLVHLTDPHMSSLADQGFSSLRGKRWSGYLSWRKNRSKKYLPAVLDRLVAAIHAEKPDQVLLTGDLIHIGLPSEISEAANWMASLGSAEKVMLVPGNHDIYASDSSGPVERAWQDYLFAENDGQFPTLRRRGNVSLIGLSSAVVTPVFMASGKLGKQQLERFEALLQRETEAGQLVCVLIHHPPLPGMTDRRKGLVDTAALEAALDRHPPAMIFHGHLHHNREWLHGDTRVYCTSAASSCSDASFRLIDIDEDDDCFRLTMTLKSISMEDKEEPGFVTVDQQSWERVRA